MFSTYDEYKAHDDDYWAPVDDAEEPEKDETYTTVPELEKVRERLEEATGLICAAYRGAVLSRERRAALERIERDLFLEISDILEELDHR